jgi:Novel STAND NTPase 1
VTCPRTNGASGWPRDPYKGLNYFAASDAPLFGQRDVEIDEATRLLYSFDTRVVLLHGGTGTGKSSFLRAGLCPHLQRMSREEGRRFFFLREMRPDGSAGDPLMIRATDDPVARIFEALQNVAKSTSNILPEGVREGVHQSLAEPLPHNRLDALPPILAALGKLTEPPQRDTLVLLIDQAEEVLTLRGTSSADNVRRAFFELIEQVCFRSLDLRLIVALRTEYYGRFCSFF